MSSFRGEICKPWINGCLCSICKYRRAPKGAPKECHGGGCMDCDPERTEPDDGDDYGPTRECKFFIVKDMK